MSVVNSYMVILKCNSSEPCSHGCPKAPIAQSLCCLNLMRTFGSHLPKIRFNIVVSSALSPLQ